MWTIWKRRAIRVNATTVSQSSLSVASEKLDDAKLDLLGDYFVGERIRERMWLTFEHFVALYQMGRWYERVI